MQNVLKCYLKRTKNNPHRTVIRRAIETQLLLLTPFSPHYCEELWNKLGKDTFISAEHWPDYDESIINPELDYAEEFIAATGEDIKSVLNLAKVEQPKKITLFIAEGWKYDFMKTFKDAFSKTRNTTELIKTCLLSGHEKEISSIVPALIKNPGKVPSVILSEELEERILYENLAYLTYEFDREIEIVKASLSTNKKAGQALPGKVAIVVE